jgi:hypothetical protein
MPTSEQTYGAIGHNRTVGIELVWEQAAEENIWIYVTPSNSRIETTSE